MLQRSLYTLKQMFRYKKSLKAMSGGCFINCVTGITPEFLADKKVKYLALDFDGVLASHGKPQMHGDAFVWLKEFVTKFPQERIFILSNKPTQERLEYFQKHFPKIRFISGVAKKPYPDGLNKIVELLECDSRELALVDDRLLTGCLACLIAGSYPILVTKPYIDEENYTRQERFFKFLRYSEQKIFL